MSLVNPEQDDDLEAEDQAIRDAEKPPEPEKPLPVGGDLAQLIESLTNGASDASTEG